MDVVCKNCGSINDYTIIVKAHNQCAYCNGCEKYIKNIPYADDIKIYFGKYKGKRIKEILDIGYLNWIIQNIDLKEGLKKEVLNQLNRLRN